MTEDLYLRFAALLAAALLVPSVTFAMFAVIHRNLMFWRYLSAGTFLLFIASAISATRDILPALLPLIVSNILVGAGYYLNLKSVLSVYQLTTWKRLDEVALAIYGATVIFVNIFFNTYENRVLVVSAGIMFFSIMIGLSAYRSARQKICPGTVMLLGFAIANIIIAMSRFLSVHPLSDKLFLISFWDQVFFIWSIAATFLFSFAQFINGNTIIQKENLKILQEAKWHLECEKELSIQLAIANEEQKSLQKLLLHEVKRPLSAIQAALQASHSMGVELDYSKASRLSALTEQATAYLEGISQFQDVSELFEAPNWSQLPVSQVIRDITTKWGIEVSCSQELEDKELRCDLLLVDIAISNLIENARKFGRNAQSVSIRLLSIDGKLQIDVQDDGPGIPKAEWTKVWRKFYKIDDETHSALTGCGLGLHIVTQVAHTHEGRAYVVSDKPSVIRLELPLVRRDGANG